VKDTRADVLENEMRTMKEQIYSPLHRVDLITTYERWKANLKYFIVKVWRTHFFELRTTGCVSSIPAANCRRLPLVSLPNHRLTRTSEFAWKRSTFVAKQVQHE